jgi:hypothetical protein
MFKLCSTLLGTMLITTTIAQDVTNDWEKVPKHFKYASDGLSCKVRYDGIVTDLKTNDSVILKQSQLVGKYDIVNGKKHRTLFSQYHDRTEPLLIKKLGDNKYLLKKNGLLANTAHKPGAKYQQTMKLEPDSIEFSFEVELLVPLAAKSEIFYSANYMPINTFKGKKIKLTAIENDNSDKTEVEQNLTFPETYSKTAPLKATAKNAEIFLNDKSLLVFMTGDKSIIKIFDSRSYGSDSYRFNITPDISYHSEPKAYPVGTKFKWSFKIVLQKKQPNNP